MKSATATLIISKTVWLIADVPTAAEDYDKWPWADLTMLNPGAETIYVNVTEHLENQV
jgi:hypothetical protein